jgi:antitoxin MazE
MKLEIRQVGNSYGVILPKKIMDELHVGKGDSLYVLEVEGGISLTPYDPHFDDVMEAYDGFSKKYRNALKKLAK